MVVVAAVGEFDFLHVSMDQGLQGARIDAEDTRSVTLNELE